ncbi:MAG: hypothetical protein U0228_27775 [Myxococcaceae bacterium]
MNGTNRSWLALLGVLAGGLLVAGCGTTTDNDAGSTCTTDSQCGTGKGCHPVLKTCVSTCTSGSDCPASEKTCAKIGSSTTTFCTCATDALCNTAVPGNVCNQATLQCTAKCTANSSCPSGSTCNTTTGVCSAVGGTDGGTDGGSDAGMMDAGTDAGTTCDYSRGQPDTCGYGSFCDGTNNCFVITNGTCNNVAGRPAWTNQSTGPVIYQANDEAVDDASACASGTPFTTTVFAYAPAGSTFPAMKSALPGFFYYTTSGTQVDIPTNLLTQTNYTLYANGTVMSAKFTLCSSTATTSLVAGFGFTNGNSFCATLTH